MSERLGTSQDFEYVASGAHTGKNAAGQWCRAFKALEAGDMTITPAKAGSTPQGPFPVVAGATYEVSGAVTASTGAYLVLW